MEETQEEGQVKLIVSLEKEEDDYPPVDHEELWTTPSGEGLFRIDNIPFFARGLARGDIVSAVAEEEVLRFQEVVQASGHSTIRLLVGNAEAVPTIVERFEGHGCDSEIAFDRLVALDVPPSVSVADLKEKLNLGLMQAQWEYEEACIVSTGEEEA